MALMKEQNKTPKKKKPKQNRDKQSIRCKVQNTGYRMLRELIGYCNSIKKNQAEMKVTLSEIKKNIQRINNGGDEAENQINNL